MADVEKTLVLFKPDAVQRGVVGEILTRFERVGLKIVGTKMIAPDRDHYYKHYEDIGKMVTRRGEDTFNITLDLMLQGPVIAMVFEGVEAVALVRKLVGTTEPKSAAPGTIRGDFGLSRQMNLVHGSDSPEAAAREIAIYFKPEELLTYSASLDPWTCAGDEK